MKVKLPFPLIEYRALNARQKENYNFQKISGMLADCGFSTIRLSDDWNGADFIAQHIDGVSVLRVQLKGRLTFAKKYRKRGLWICFRDAKTGHAFLFPHDRVLRQFLRAGRAIKRSSSWRKKGGYSFGGLAEWMLPILKKYRLPLRQPR